MLQLRPQSRLAQNALQRMTNSYQQVPLAFQGQVERTTAA